MRAAILYGQEDVRVEQVLPRALAPGEVRIQIEAALTCGTDLKVFKRGYHARMIVPPAVFGHELAGVISETQAPEETAQTPGPGAGSAEHEFVARAVGASLRPAPKIGDRVVVANSAPCGNCFYCRANQENLCDDLLFLNGAYAESIVVPARIVQKNLWPLKPGTAFRDAALVEPLACVVQGIEDAKLRAGQRVLVLGAGPIGLMFVVLARQLGCTVTVAGRGEGRLQTARRLGAETAIPVVTGDELEPGSLPGSPFDVVIEAVGKPETWEAAVPLTRKGGLVNFFGGCPAGTKVALDTGLIHYSNLTLVASFHHTPRAVGRALELIESGIINAADFVDGQWPLSRLPELFQSMAAGNRAVKTFINVKA
ncbi:MAG TPA: alcohol dehydrogenase catalytic domain-containing protein [Verrucomicrobiae bacterium]|nr:alcohol dehydrogenase catalytic domain-containing protein [Verrucomicrobiae bacterium]